MGRVAGLLVPRGAPVFSVMSFCRLVSAVIAVLLMSGSPHGQSPVDLTPDERALLAHVEARNGEALALLERAVNINSGTQNLAGVREVGKLFAAELDALGFTTRWVDGAPFKRAGHLVAERARPGRRVLLIGHLDTVFEADSPFQKFERLNERQARGPGIIDMKGGNVIIVQTLKALLAAGALDRMHVTVVMTGDEEASGDPQDVARAALVAAAKGVDVAIGFEDGAGDPRSAVIGRRGTTAWTLTVTGKPAHSSQIFRPDIGYGAIFEAARILNVFRETLAGEPHLTFNPALVVGGTKAELDTDAGARVGLRQGQRHPRTRHRLRRPARALDRAVRPGAQADGGDRRLVVARADERRRLRSTKAIRRSRRPRAIASCSRCTTRPAATSAPGPSPPSIPIAPAPPTSRSSPGTCR